MTNRILLDLQYFPPVQFFTKLLAYDEVQIEGCEHYQKGSYRNRCRIAGPNGLQRLSVPLGKGKNQQLPIREVRISYQEPWQRQHWQSLQTAYGNAPYFLHYEEELRPFFEQPFEHLFDLNLALLRKLMPMLGLRTSLTFTEVYRDDPAEPATLDFRNGIFPKKHRQKEDPAFEPARYVQVFAERHGFLPNLSILDLLFCTGPQAPLILRDSIVKSE